MDELPRERMVKGKKVKVSLAETVPEEESVNRAEKMRKIR